MYELVHILGQGETAVSVTANSLDAELLRQRHLRSITPGVVEVREAKAAKGKAKAKK
jgi:hypothetical protein